MANNLDGVRRDPSVGIGSTRSPLSGYPNNPSDDAEFSHDPEKGIARTANSFAMGIEILENCVNCGRAFRPLDMLAHNQAEGRNDDDERPGLREFQI